MAMRENCISNSWSCDLQVVKKGLQSHRGNFGPLASRMGGLRFAVSKSMEMALARCVNRDQLYSFVASSSSRNGMHEARGDILG